DGWNIIYWHNHDQPRVLSHYGNDTEYRERSAMMLLYTLYLMPGTPIIYQGEEIGMSNVDYEYLEDFRDVEVFTEYKNFISRGATHEVSMQALRDRSRDNARSPMQWDSEVNSGFSKTNPWINVNSNYKDVNVKSQLKDKDSILNSYKAILAYRKANKLNNGIIEFIDIKNNDSYIYKNETEDYINIVVANFRSYNINIHLEFDIREYDLVFTNLVKRTLENHMELAPYEALVFKQRK
ncbi:MAG: alpha-amylase family glycosyl hydrolase, partial [Candidatus Izemoplasma sp.]